MKALVLLLLVAANSFAASWFVTISGLGGETEYETRFAGWAADLDKAVRGIPDAHVHTYVGKVATRETLRKAFAEFAVNVKKEDTFTVVLIGHGTFDGVDYKFNIPGPDFTAGELGGWCDKIAAEKQLIVNTTSAGGASIAVLQKPNTQLLVPPAVVRKRTPHCLRATSWKPFMTRERIPTRTKF